MRAAEDLKERIRATTETSDGSIYFSTDSGRIYLLSYNK